MYLRTQMQCKPNRARLYSERTSVIMCNVAVCQSLYLAFGNKRQVTQWLSGLNLVEVGLRIGFLADNLSLLAHTPRAPWQTDTNESLCHCRWLCHKIQMRSKKNTPMPAHARYILTDACQIFLWRSLGDGFDESAKWLATDIDSHCQWFGLRLIANTAKH